MKFEFFQSKEGEQFCFRLVDSNGQIILISQKYRSRGGAARGLRSVQKNAAFAKNYHCLRARNGQYYFNLKAGNGRVIATSLMQATAIDIEKYKVLVQEFVGEKGD